MNLPGLDPRFLETQTTRHDKAGLRESASTGSLSGASGFARQALVSHEHLSDS